MAIKAFKLDLTPEQVVTFAAALEDLVATAPRHPASAAAVAAGVEGSTAYLAQEYVPGEALDAVLRQFGPPSPREALAVLERLAGALDRAAGEGIHHGALHPRDILIAEEETRLIDLGVVQALERCGVRAPIRRPYTAPERIAGEHWDGPADIFGLGAIAFELLTGRRITGPGPPSGRLDELAGADVALIGDVLARALDEDPSSRFPSAADLVDGLAPALEAAQRTPSPQKRHPRTTPPQPVFADDRLPAFADDRAGEPVRSEAPPAPDDLPPPSTGELPLMALTGAIDDRFADAADPEPRPPAPRVHVRDGAPFGGTLWQEPRREHADERRLFPLLVAVLVGLAVGFGWGYWTAWRTLERDAAGPGIETAATTPPSEPAPAPGEASPVQMQDTPVEIQDPEVIGERNLPSPAAGSSRRAPSTPPAAPAARAPQQRAADTPTPAGRLLVRSTPAGARVRVDGQVRGTTPLALRELPLGPATVTIERDGYRPATRRLTLTATRPAATLDVELEGLAPSGRATGAGVLVVESRPAGARVLVDGEDVGTTPLSLPEAPSGPRNVRIVLEGFLPWTTTVQVEPGQRTRVAASLEQGSSP